MTEQKHNLPSASPTRHISSLREWDKNPRSITKEGFDRLKKQIQKLGQYKPLLITPDGEVLGGNMRLKAYRELGIEDIWVSVVTPKDEAEKLEYALSDNDRAGFYDDDLLANLIPEYPDFDWSQFTVDMRPPQTIQELINSVSPEIIDEISLPDGDRPGFEQMTFTLSTEQAQGVRKALDMAKEREVFDQLENDNSNGNALFSICKKYAGD